MTGRTRRVVLAALGLFLMVALPVFARGEVRATTSVEPRRIPVDGTVQLRVVVEGPNLGSVAPPSLNHLEDWTVVNGPSVSSQFRFINGVSTSSRSFSWILAPPGTGTFTFPAMSLDLGRETVTTKPVTVEVYATVTGGSSGEPAPDKPTSSGDDDAEEVFFRTILEPREPYVGQQATLSYDLYTLVEVASVPQAQESPVYPNFWKEELDRPQKIRPRSAIIGGREYQVYTVRKVALFPTASGETTLPPLTFSVPVKSRSVSRFRRSFFFDPVETVYKRAPRLTVNVRPLPPEGRPDEFSNAVGDFRLDVEADRQEAATGDAVSFSVEIEGTGNLASIKAPALTVPDGFTVYPPETRQSVSPDRDGMFAGAKTWDYIVVPREPGEVALPEVRFAYFDPAVGAYRTLTGGGGNISITGEPLADADDLPGAPARRALERLGSDIHFIDTAVDDLKRSEAPLYRSSWFWFLLVTPPAVNGLALLARWRRRRQLERTPELRRRRARRAALRRLGRAREAVAEDGAGRFYGELAQALSGYIADKFGHQASGLTYDRIAALLAGSSSPEEAHGEFLDVLETCDCARFAPAAEDRSARESLLSRAEQAIVSLEDTL